MLLPLLLTMVGAAAAPASAAGPIERMPLWRLQVVITTVGNSDDGDGAGDGTPMLRLNRTATGVRVLNPRASKAFEPIPGLGARVDRYDLRLLDSPSRITMLRLGIAGDGGWCVRKIELLFNGKPAFRDRIDKDRCRITPAKPLEYTSAQLRSNALWAGFSPPPLPRRLDRVDLEEIVTGVTGSTLRSLSGTDWDRAVPLTIARLTSKTFRVRFGIWVALDDSAGDSFRVRVSHVVRLFAGPEGRLRATGIGASCSPACNNHQEVALSDAVVAQLNTALNRLTVRPAGETDPLSFGMDALKNIAWRWVPVIRP